MSEKNERTEVWVKLEGVLAQESDPPSRWAIGAKLPHAEEVIAFAREFGEPIIYGTACESPRGVRAVQRWLFANGIDCEVDYRGTTEPPAGVAVIAQWPLPVRNEEKGEPKDDPPSTE